jgi:hypothetical protein
MSAWIHRPFTDLVFLSFLWVPAFGAFVWADRSGLPDRGRPFLLAAILFLNFLHRHLTFPLVYADPEEFRRRRAAYILLPLLFAGIAVAAVVHVTPPERLTKPVPPDLRLGDGAVVDFLVERDGRMHRTSARLRGHEAGAAEVARAWAPALQGLLEPAVEGDAIRIRPASPNVTRWVVASGSPSLLQPLGLPVGRWAVPVRPGFQILLAVAVLWTMFHSVMQKVGLLRIYSRKAGVTNPWIDRLFVWSWFAFVLLRLGSLPAVRAQATSLAVAGAWISTALEAAGTLLPALSWIALAVAVVVTALYVRQERALGWPPGKACFALSLLGLYGVFFYDLLAGYAVFAFSHAVEYLAFVNLYAGRKYAARPPESSPLARAARKQAWAFGGFVVVVGGAFLLWHAGSRQTLGGYVVGSGFLHFLYDGWLWKLRRPEVSAPLVNPAAGSAP